MLLGRDADLEMLESALREADRPVVLHGEAGVGKTSLIRQAVQLSGRRGFEAGCLATLSWMPYLPLHRAFGGVAGPATGSRPGRWSVLTDLRAGDAAYVAAEVETIVGDGVLVLDDVQWADSSTRAVLPLLVGRVRLLAAVRRADPGAAEALRLVRDAGLTVLDISPLPAAYAGALARRVRPDLSPDAVAEIVHRSGGNPLLVEEHTSTGAAGASLRLALAARMRQLPPDCREAVGLLALAGKPLPVAGLGDAADRLRDTGLLREQDGEVTLRHGLFAELAAEELDPALRRVLHERLAGQLSDPGEVARHLLAAGQREQAYRAAVRAAEAAASPGERAQHLGLAASCRDGRDAGELRLHAAEQLAQAGQYAAAEPLLAGVDLADPVTAARAAAIRLRVRYEELDREACRQALAEGLAAASGTGHPVEVQLACEQAFVALMVDYQVQSALELAHHAATMAEQRGLHRARAHYVLGTTAYIAGEPIWEENLTAAVRLAASEGELAVECAAGNNLITAHESSGIPERGRQIAGEMIERARLLHLTEWRQQFEAMKINLDCHAGAYAEVLAGSERLLAERLRPATRRQVRMTTCLALVDTGRIDEAFAAIEAIIAEESDPDTRQESAHFHRAEALLWGGSPARALAEWPAHRAQTAESSDLLAFSSPTFAWAAYWAGQSLPEFGDLATNTRMCQAVPFEIAGIRALAAADWQAAEEQFDRAAERWRVYNRRNEIRCRWAAGEAARLAGRTAEAVQRLEHAERAAEQHGMAPLVGRIRTSLRAAGVRRSAQRVTGRRAGNGAGGSGPAALSGREREVLILVGQGLSDTAIAARLGVSPRTVEAQLASARRKLGARTRHQAATMLRDSVAR
jgi:DNA-binding CsgD family transcriptional regulator